MNTTQHFSLEAVAAKICEQQSLNIDDLFTHYLGKEESPVLPTVQEIWQEEGQAILYVHKQAIGDKISKEKLAALIHWCIDNGMEKTQAERAIQQFFKILSMRLSQFRIFQELYRRNQVMNVQPLQMKMQGISDRLPEKDQLLLAYYLPFREKIQQDPELMGRCFSSFLGVEIMVQKVTKNICFHQNPETWKVGLNTIINPENHEESYDYEVRINPKNEADLTVALAGSERRMFLKNYLYPKFLPEGKKVKTTLDWQAQKHLFGINIEGKNNGIKQRIVSG